MTELYSTITSCRSCASPQLATVLDLGELYISDFITKDTPEHKAPLELVCCQECSLVQLRHTVNRDHLYKDHYMYRSGTNESMVVALQNVVDDACSRVNLLTFDKVLDIGCNDGTLLSLYPKRIDAYGYEPALNLQAEAKKKSRGCIYPLYFPPPWGPHDKFKIITSIAQFYNVDDLDGYVKKIKHALKRDGVWIVQFQDLESMLLANALDNICHEHLTYISQQALEYSLKRHGLRIETKSFNKTNGGSVRYVIKHGEIPEVYLFDWTAEIRAFADRVRELRIEAINLLHRLKLQKKKVIGIAASTKGNTLLQWYGIDSSLISAIADRNPEKCGKMTVGTHIPIISEEELYRQKPDYLFALAWHFIDGFKARYADLSAQWIVPLPSLSLGGKPCQSITAGHSEDHLAATI